MASFPTDWCAHQRQWELCFPPSSRTPGGLQSSRSCPAWLSWGRVPGLPRSRHFLTVGRMNLPRLPRTFGLPFHFVTCYGLNSATPEFIHSSLNPQVCKYDCTWNYMSLIVLTRENRDAKEEVRKFTGRRQCLHLEGRNYRGN